MILNLRGGGDGARDTAGGFFGPVQSAVSAVVKPVSDFFGSIGSLGSKDQQIADLQAQIDELQQQLNTTDFDRNRARELDELLGLAGRGQYEIVPAQVVATGPAQGFGWTVTIDAGTKDGIKVDQNVVNGQGLVGRVIRVNESTAVVALLVDATSTVGAQVEASLEQGFLNGTGDPRTLELQLLDPFAPVQKGDRLVSFGFVGGVYVAGIPLGTITEVRGTPGQLARIATVVPFVDVTRLDLVGVIVQPPRTDPRDSVLPPKPSASTSPPASGSTGTSSSASASPSASAS
ncbi:MAG: rod shape-determining protein MreC [Candidatus Nanopelagicales bacterium]